MDYSAPNLKLETSAFVETKKDESCKRIVGGNDEFIMLDLQYCLEELTNTSPLRINFNANASVSNPEASGIITTTSGSQLGTVTR